MGAALAAALKLILANPEIIAAGFTAIEDAVSLVKSAFNLNKVGAMTDAQLQGVLASVAAADAVSTGALDAAVAAHRAWKATLPAA